jgi:hypothetical protein
MLPLSRANCSANWNQELHRRFWEARPSQTAPASSDEIEGLTGERELSHHLP